jgi:hypothetical protein
MTWPSPRRLPFPLVAFAGVSLASSAAHAQPPDADDFEDGPFVYVAPGIAGLAFGDDEADAAEDLLDLNYTTQVGGGYFLRRGAFMMSFGAAAELMVYNFEHPGWVDADGVLFRLLPEVRLGGGGDWFFIYGNIKPGLAVSHYDWDYDQGWDCGGRWHNYCGPNDFDGDHYDDTAPGFNMGFGGGAAFKIWKGLTVGAESGFDFSFFGDDHGFERVFVADFILFAGWWF